MYKLIARTADGTVLKAGDVIENFAGEKFKFIAISSRGRIYAKNDALSYEFYPGVFPNVFVDRADNG